MLYTLSVRALLAGYLLQSNKKDEGWVGKRMEVLLASVIQPTARKKQANNRTWCAETTAEFEGGPMHHNLWS